MHALLRICSFLICAIMYQTHVVYSLSRYIFYIVIHINMPIADIPELRHTSNAGLYAISPTPPSKKKTIASFEAGQSVNFKDDYHLCFNEGYYIYCILPIVKDLHHEDPLAERKKKILALTRRLETELFKLIHHHNWNYAQREQQNRNGME